MLRVVIFINLDSRSFLTIKQVFASGRMGERNGCIE